MDPNEFSVFGEWLSDVTQRDHPYLLKVSRDDIQPCLTFSNAQVLFLGLDLYPYMARVAPALIFEGEIFSCTLLAC